MATGDALRAFITVLPAELPDKSMFATIVLVARYRRPGWVWLGATAAFAIHVTVAAAAGSAISLLPDTVVKLAVLVMFAIGAVALWRAAGSGEEDDEVEPDVTGRATIRTTVGASFALIALAEWGDLTQVATAGLAASSGAPVATALGALAALGTVAGLAVTVGRQLVARVPIHRVNLVGAVVFGALAVWTLVELLS